MKRLIMCLAAALAACAVLGAAAAETAQPVTAAELDGLLESVRTQALAGEPLNDPADAEAQSEDGTLFRYEVARIYGEGTALGAGTPVNALVFEDSEGPVFRGTGIDTAAEELLYAFPLENAELAGTREEALLYLHDTEAGGFDYGLLLRDGQRTAAVEYGEVTPEGDAFRRAAVTYALDESLVTAIRVDGLNPAGSGRLDAAQANEFLAGLKELAGHDEYRAVKSSRNGLELTPFDENDLVFDGFSYTAMQPATLPGNPETELIDNEDGTWLLCCDGDGYEAVFRCGEHGENAAILSFEIRDDGIEGPRCVRLGDLFSDDFCRFRSGENEMSADMTELLYGTEGSASWGFASYDPEEMILRYVTETQSGLRVELILRYTEHYLTEIILQTVNT